MTQHRHDTGTCQVCHQSKPINRLLPAAIVRGGVKELIRQDHADWDDHGYICFGCLNQCRSEYVQQLMEKDLGELDELEREVVESMQDNALLSENINEEYERSLTTGDHIADKVAELGGSWKFIIWFGVLLIVWVAANSVLLLWQPFDPYPFILLNLVLSSLAAIQAPIIMMSQNRQEDRDRIRAENDYQVNLKAEMEYRIIVDWALRSNHAYVAVAVNGAGPPRKANPILPAVALLLHSLPRPVRGG
jgi:uncharacterized membrane protein